MDRLTRLYPFGGKTGYFGGCDPHFALYLQGYDF